MGRERDRKGQLAREYKFEQVRAERETEWARQDAHLSSWMLLHCRSSIGCCAWKKSGEFWLTMRRTSHLKCPIPWHLRPLLLESYTLEHRPLLPFRPPPAITITNTTQAQSRLTFPISHRLISKPLYMRQKHAEASGGTAQLDPARLKLGRKVSATNKFRNRGRTE